MYQGGNFSQNFQFVQPLRPLKLHTEENAEEYATILNQFKCCKYCFRWEQKLQNLSGVALPQDHIIVSGYLEQTKLVHLHLPLLGFFPICNKIFPIIDPCKFVFTSGTGSAILVKMLKLYSLLGQSGFCLIFILSKS